jgi:hypothetical protein
MAKNELVLLYRLDPSSEKGQKVREVLAQLQIRTKTLTEDMLGQTIGYLAEISGFPAGPAHPGAEPAAEATGEVLLMKDISDERIDQILRGFREKGVGPIALKACVTPHNQKWTLLELIHELSREHAVMQRYNQLHQSVQMADRLLADSAARNSISAADRQAQLFSPEERNLASAARDARQILNARDLPEMAEIDSVLSRLQAALAACLS